MSVERAVERALAAGAGEAEAYSSEEATREVRVHGGAVESLTAATQRGIGIRAWIGHRVGYAFGTDLSDAGIDAIAARAAAAAAAADEDEFAGPPSDEAVAEPIDGLTDASIRDWTTDRVTDLALEVERTALAADSRVIGVETAVYVDSSERIAIASSTGLGGSYESTSCYAYLQALAQGDDGLETGLGFGLARGPGGLDPAAIGREAADRSTAMIGSIKPKSRSCPVILDPAVAASFVGLLGGAMSARAVQRGRSPLAGQIGAQVASPAFVLRDDGLVPEGFATAPIDGEGVPRRRTPLIADGNLQTYLYDTYAARRGDASSTGNAGRSGYRAGPSVAPSNLVVEPGSESFEELLARAGNGVYVTDVAGLHSGVNPVTGVFSVGASGRSIEAGELAGALSEFTIASDLVSMLRAVVATGSEPRWMPFGGSVSTPPLLVAEMAVSGS